VAFVHVTTDYLHRSEKLKIYNFILCSWLLAESKRDDDVQSEEGDGRRSGGAQYSLAHQAAVTATPATWRRSVAGSDGADEATGCGLSGNISSSCSTPAGAKRGGKKEIRSFLLPANS
jgi:hypothetical protein